MGYRHAIDSVAVRDARLFGWGWFLDDDAPAEAIHLSIELADGSCRRLHCPQTGSRPDLREAYPQLPHAAGGGFMLQARLPARADIVRIELDARLRNGERVLLALPELERACASTDGDPAAAVPGSGGSRLRLAWNLVRQAQWDALRKRTREFIRRWIGRSQQVRHIATAGHAGGDTWIVLDHAMGGGANHFRNEKVDEWRAAGRDVRVVTPRLDSLEYAVEGIAPGGAEWRQCYPDLAACLQALGPCARIVVNDLVSFDDPLRVLAWAIARKREGARLLFYLHDFHAVCPAWTLTAANGRDCGVPDHAECARCLPANTAPFLAMMPSLDMPEWRRMWDEFLREADEIVAFSASSIAILRRAHPMLDPARIELRPHSTVYLGAVPPAFKPRLGEIATIGVVGAISAYKGAGIVAGMANLIEREGWPARIVIVGSIDGVPPSPALRITGPYSTGELRDVLEREGIDIAFLPSIWHETFSYVTAELMHYRVPLAVFDLGAPAERVRAYPLGRIIPAVDARIALAEILAFHRSLAAAVAAGMDPFVEPS